MDKLREDFYTTKKHLKTIFDGMIQRCHNPNNYAYKYYGGKGIGICKEWMDHIDLFVVFAIENGWEPGLDIHRMNPHKGYSPNNCMFLDGSTHASLHQEFRREQREG